MNRAAPVKWNTFRIEGYARNRAFCTATVNNHFIVIETEHCGAHRVTVYLGRALLLESKHGSLERAKRRAREFAQWHAR